MFNQISKDVNQLISSHEKVISADLAKYDSFFEAQHIAKKIFAPDFPKAQFLCLSREPNPKRIGAVEVLPWREGIARILHG